MLTLYVGWQFLHSKFFSKEASYRISQVLNNKIGTDIKFETVSFKVFPPTTIFNKVQVKKESLPKFAYTLEADELKIGFSFFSFFSSELEIDEIYLDKANLKLQIEEDKEEFDWKSINLNELFSKYEEIFKKSPLRLNLFKLSNSVINVNGTTAEVNNVSLLPHKREIRLKVDLQKIKSTKQIPSFKKDQIGVLIGQVRLIKSKLIIDEIYVEDEIIRSKLQGEFVQDRKNLMMKVVLSGQALFEKFLENVEIPENLKSLNRISSFINFNAELEGGWLNPNVNLDLKLKDFKSEWADLESIEALLIKKSNEIKLKRFVAVNKQEKYRLEKEISFYNINSRSFNKNTASFILDLAETNTFLKTIKETLSSLKAKISGVVEVQWNGEGVEFRLRPNTKISPVKLEFNASKPILNIPTIEVSKFNLFLNKEYEVEVESTLRMPDSVLNFDGVLLSKSLEIKFYDSKIDMKRLGPISGVNIEGRGDFGLKISGPYDDVNFDFKVDWNNFSVVDLHFGHVRSEFELGLKDLEMKIRKLDGEFDKTKFTAEGVLLFGDISGLDLNLDFQTSTFSNAKKMYNLIFKDIKNLPSDLDFNFVSNYKISGGFDVKNLEVNGVIKGTDLIVYGEDVDSFQSDFRFKNEVLNFKRLKFKKNRGTITANYSLDTSNGYMEIDALSNGLKITDLKKYKNLNFDYDGVISAEYDGNGTSENFTSRLNFKIPDAFIDNTPVSPSSGVVYLNHDGVQVRSNLLGGKLKIDSKYNMIKKSIVLVSKLDTGDVRELLGAVSAHNLTDKNLEGKINVTANMEINLSPFDISNLDLRINQLSLKRNDINLRIDPLKNSVLISDGIIKKWDLHFIDGTDYLISTGKNINSNIVCNQEFSIKSNLAELFTEIAEKGIGNIKGKNQLTIGKEVGFDYFELIGNNNSFKLKNVPGFFKGINFEVRKNKEAFELTRLSGKYGEGEVSASGVIAFKKIFPDLDVFPLIKLDFKLDRGSIPLFKKSSVLLSAYGNISGNKFPYNLNAKAVIHNGEILDSLNEITSSTKYQTNDFTNYLPENNNSATNLALLNIDFETGNQIGFKNNLAEVYVKLRGNVAGSLLKPTIVSRVDVVPQVSKFKFKGHEFILKEGSLDVKDTSAEKMSDVKFVGFAKFPEFEIKLDVSGKLDKLNVLLTSDPYLSQEDILSLLTFGITSSDSKNLSEEEKRNSTLVGVGSLVLSQFNINEDINSILGVNLSVSPEFQQEEASLISGKSAVSDSSASRLKSSTKIKIDKRLSRKVNVSLSSTVGGTLEQKQEMNVNYNINKNVSVEGVYEMKPSESESTTTPNSLGLDLKIKWSF